MTVDGLRIGHGYDVHRFAPSFDEKNPLVLAGVRLPEARTLEAHSDGDLVLHAVCDAILGALGQGDIGQHFPDGDPQFADVDSRLLLARVLAIVDAFPLFLRAAGREGLVKSLDKRIDKRLVKQWRTLHEALRDPAHDRHRLRLLIKRARYGDEAYPQLDHAGKKLQRVLKKAQGDLGDWHDRLQWLLQARDHADLLPCKADWEQELHEAERQSDVTLDTLQEALARRYHGK